MRVQRYNIFFFQQIFPSFFFKKKQFILFSLQKQQFSHV